MSETVTRFPRRWAQSEQIGELTTTFTGDFNIAEDISGLKGVRSTFATAFNEWKDDVRYMANLAIVTNMKCWEHYGSGNEELMDIVASVGNFDKVAANKMMIEISKSMATVEKKCKKKLTA